MSIGGSGSNKLCSVKDGYGCALNGSAVLVNNSYGEIDVLLRFKNLLVGIAAAFALIKLIARSAFGRVNGFKKNILVAKRLSY